jgi:NADH-quinone oxidoreductase subunit E
MSYLGRLIGNGTIRGILKKYPETQKRSAVMPLLDLAQRQSGGSIPHPAIEHIAEMLDMAYIRVMEIATFYSMFYLKPMGKHHIQICGTTPCWLRGAGDIRKLCEEHLGIDINQTTTDGMFTLSEVECLGACVNAPVVQIGDDYHEDLTVDHMRGILDDLADGKHVRPGSCIGRQCSKAEEVTDVKK